jgi:O-antigen/teichoic acid export membrane protein
MHIPKRRQSPFIDYGVDISRSTATYALGTAAILPIGIASLAVTTRYLTPTNFGELAVLFTFGALLTTVYNLGTLHGTFMRVFGLGEGGDDVAEDVAGVEVGTVTVEAGKERLALGTGLCLTLLVVAAGTMVVFAAAPLLAEALLREHPRADLVRIAAVSAGLGSVWRLFVNLYRMERRPWLFSLMNVSRPALALTYTIPLLIQGEGARGVLLGTIAGTITSLVIMGITSRKTWSLRFDRTEASAIIELGKRFLGVSLGMWFIHSADVILLSWFAPPSQVAIYRVASRLSSFSSYLVSAFLMAWSPMDRTALVQGLHETERRSRVRGLIIRYYVISALSVLLVLAIGAHAVVKVAAASYAGAAPLIPVVGAGIVAYGFYTVVARTTVFPGKARYYNLVTIGCCFLLVATCCAFIPVAGAYGAAAALVVTMLAGTGVFIRRAQRSDEPLELDWRRVAGVTALCGAELALSHASPSGAAGVAMDCGIVFLHPFLLIALGIVDRRHLRPLFEVLRRTLIRDRLSRARFEQALPLLSSPERAALEAVMRDGEPMASYAARVGVTETVVAARLVRAARKLDDSDRRSVYDHEIGAALLAQLSPLQRDGLISSLIRRPDVQPLDVDRVQRAFSMLTRTPRRRWPASDARSLDSRPS